MKYHRKGNMLGKWKSASIVGFGMTGIGLVCTAMIVGQIFPVVFSGQVPDISTLELALEVTVGLIFLIAGFALMVVGSDPFDDSSNEFLSEIDRDGGVD